MQDVTRTLEYLAPRLSPDLYAYWATGGEYQRWPHIRHIGRILAERIAAGGARIIVNLPPGYGKSWLCSVWMPLWYLDLWPSAKAVCAAATSQLALRNARWVRDRAEQNERVRERVRLREDNRAAGFWQTREEGGMLAVGVGSGLLGHRANLLLIDDPYPTWAEAQSAAYRRGVEEWYDGTAHSRLEPGASVVLIMHRMHEADIAAYLTAREPGTWTVISLPDFAERGDALGRAPGAPLCPERYTAEDIKATRRGIGKAMFAAMHQQRPLKSGSGNAYHAFDPSPYPNGNTSEDIAWDYSLPLHVALDYNVVPGMHAVLGQYNPWDDTAYALDEVFAPGMRLHACLREIERRVRELSAARAAGAAQAERGAILSRGGLAWPYIEVFGDAAKGTTTLTSATHHSTVRQWLRRLRWPYRWRVPAANPRVVERVDRFNEALRDSEGAVHYVLNPRRCPRLYRDLQEVRMEGAGLDKGNPELTHPSDAEGYRLHRIRPGRFYRPHGPASLTVTGAGEPLAIGGEPVE